MFVSSNYKYVTSLSKEEYFTKEISNACTGKTSDPKNREIKKKYGLPTNRGTSYEQIIGITPEDHLKAMLSGKVMCNLFTPEKERTDGSFGSTQKADQYFLGSFTIGVDIDETSYTSITEFIDKLSLKPTFYYSSYSHLQKDENGNPKGCRFRMVYVLDQDSYIDDPYKFRYIATSLNKIIEKDTQEKLHDTCNIKCSQFFNGTNINNPDLNIEYGLTNIIYNLSDFGVTVEDYIEFLENNAEYKDKSIERRAEIISKLKETTGKDYEWKGSQDKYIVKSTNISTDPNINNNPVDDFGELSERIFKDWDKINESDFKKQADWEYQRENNKYIYRVEKDWNNNKKWQIVDDDYFALYYYQERLKDGQKRRKTLYQRICLRRIIKPDITKDEMLVNVLIDIMRFFDNTDFCLNSDTIRDLINNAFNLTIEDIKNEQKDQLEWLRANTRPKKGIIYKTREVHSLETTYDILDDLYNKFISVEENLSLLNDTFGFIIKKSLLYKYLQNRGIKPVVNGVFSDSQIKSQIDLNISLRKNLANLKANGVKISDRRLTKLIKEKKAEMDLMLSGQSFNKVQTSFNEPKEDQVEETEIITATQETKEEAKPEINTIEEPIEQPEINPYSNKFGSAPKIEFIGETFRDPVLEALGKLPKVEVKEEKPIEEPEFNNSSLNPFNKWSDQWLRDQANKNDEVVSDPVEKKENKPEEETESKEFGKVSMPKITIAMDSFNNNYMQTDLETGNIETDPKVAQIKQEEETKEPETETQEEKPTWMNFSYKVPKFGFGA